MRIALLSDIHSNWEALTAAVDDLAGRKINETWVLGDTVGYAANPNECFEWALKNARLNLLGNHEEALVDPKTLEWFSGDARQALEWTATVLKPEFLAEIKKLNYLYISENVTLAHASPDEPQEFRYLFSSRDARPSFRAFETPLCFIGHTHLPFIFSEHSGAAGYLKPGVYSLDRSHRYLLNPGSVGQPRDRDPRLSFGIFDDAKWTFEIVRLEYDNHRAAEKIRQVGLPLFLAARLL